MQPVMRVCVLLLALVLTYGYSACGHADLSAAAPSLSAISTLPPPHLDFDRQVRPILESRCTPCHFQGGTMYERLPFDRAGTIEKLGTKLFTRIKDEKEQRLIRDFLAQQAENGHDQP
jgi:hypothetical protein